MTAYSREYIYKQHINKRRRKKENRRKLNERKMKRTEIKVQHYFNAEGKFVTNLYPVCYVCSITFFLILKHYAISNFY